MDIWRLLTGHTATASQKILTNLITNHAADHFSHGISKLVFRIKKTNVGAKTNHLKLRITTWRSVIKKCRPLYLSEFHATQSATR